MGPHNIPRRNTDENHINEGHSTKLKDQPLGQGSHRKEARLEGDTVRKLLRNISLAFGNDYLVSECFMSTNPQYTTYRKTEFLLINSSGMFSEKKIIKLVLIYNYT